MALPLGATLFSSLQPNITREQFYNPELRSEEQRRIEQDARNRLHLNNELRRITAERGIQENAQRGQYGAPAGRSHKKSKRKHTRKLIPSRRIKKKINHIKKKYNTKKKKVKS